MPSSNTVSLKRPCDACRMRPGPNKCVQCQSSWYCSRECQKADWKQHKRVCKEKAEDALAKSAIVGSMDDDEIPQFHPRNLMQENNHLFDHFLALGSAFAYCVEAAVDYPEPDRPFAFRILTSFHMRHVLSFDPVIIVSPS